MLGQVALAPKSGMVRSKLRHLEQMRLFYQAWPIEQISQTLSAKLSIALGGNVEECV